MTDELNHRGKGERVDLRTSTFRCQYCNSGAEKFSDVFAEGKCVSCGGPAGVVVEISRPEDAEKLEKAIVLVYAKADVEKAKEIMNEMTEQGIDVIDPMIIADNEQAGNKMNVLSFLVDKAKYTLVIPSRQISNDPLVASAVESGLMNEKNKIVPLYPDDSYQGKASFLDTRMGVVWGKASMRAIPKDQFIGQLKTSMRTAPVSVSQ